MSGTRPRHHCSAGVIIAARFAASSRLLFNARFLESNLAWVRDPPSPHCHNVPTLYHLVLQKLDSLYNHIPDELQTRKYPRFQCLEPPGGTRLFARIRMTRISRPLLLSKFQGKRSTGRARCKLLSSFSRGKRRCSPRGSCRRHLWG